jgi:adenylate cyclase
MFVDVVGYSMITSRDERKALRLLADVRTLLESVFPNYEGRLVKTMGDGFLVEFGSAVEAVNCAVEAQRKMGNFNSTREPAEKTSIRIGIHVGDVVHSGGDVLGDAINVASRVEPLADPGGICVTRQVVDQVEGKVEFNLVSMGVRLLRNIPNPMEIYEVSRGQGSSSQTRATVLNPHRVAILPFSNLSPDPNDKYFADGMTEELISTLSKIKDLSVISRTSAMRYRDTALSREQVARELKVGTILEGSVRKAGNKVRIAAQMVDVDSDRYIWSQSYDRDLTDVLGLQGEIASQVAEGLRVQLLTKEKQGLEWKAKEDPEAYTLYLKGRYYWNERTEEGTRRATKYFQEALIADPRFARAFTGLADCYLVLGDYGWMPPAEAGKLAKGNAMKALSIDESLAEAHASLGLVYVNHLWDVASAEREFRRAIDLNPNYVATYHWYGVMLFFLRKYEDSLRMVGRALELDPYSIILRQSRGVSLIGLGRNDEAMDELRKLAAEKPDLPSVHYWMGIASLAQSNYQAAIEEHKREVEADNGDEGAKLDLAFALARSGQKGEAAEMLKGVLAKKGAYYSPSSVGLVMLELGREKEAKEWIERACAEHDSSLLYVRSVPVYERHLSYPWWAEIDQRMGFQLSE